MSFHFKDSRIVSRPDEKPQIADWEPADRLQALAVFRNRQGFRFCPALFQIFLKFLGSKLPFILDFPYPGQPCLIILRFDGLYLHHQFLIPFSIPQRQTA